MFTARLSSLVLLSVSLAAIGVVAQGCGSDASDSGSSFARRGGAGGAGGAGDDGSGNGTTGPSGGPNGHLGSGVTGGDAAPPCVNLQCQQVACPGGAHTTVSGTVYDPAGKNPLYNVVVYVPNAQPQPLTDHASCDKCDALYTGSPLVAAVTGPDGKFTLTDVPAGANIPLVIQIGKWRRQITIPTVSQCVDNPMTDPNQTRLPRNRTEGDIPKIAVSTGQADSMECLLERIGVDEAEYGGGASGAGRIHIFTGNGNSASGSTSSESTLWDSATDLSSYDIVILSCEGGENGGTKPPTSLQALEQYANGGGRVFASHFHYYWFEGAGAPADFTSTATWFPGSNNIGAGSSAVTSASINTSFPKGQAFEQWMKLTNALQSDGTLAIDDSRQNASVGPANTASTSWISDTTVPTAPNGGPTTMYFTFNTPTAAQPDSQCGRVVFSDLHVGAASNDYSNGVKAVPAGCTKADLSPQEKALEFMLFDLSSCVQPDNQPPAPPPVLPPVR
jgi:hypothetical protein